MKNILKSVFCCLLFCCTCTACGTEAESPDTLEDILNPNRRQQETQESTEYQGLFFLPDAEVTTEIPETTAIIQTELLSSSDAPETVIIPVETTGIIETVESSTAVPIEEAPETAPVQQSEPLETIIPPVEIESESETETDSVSAVSLDWESAYREFLSGNAFKRQISADVQEADTKFLLLYLNADDIPELFIQTTMEVLIYTYRQNQVVYVDSFYPSHYTYVFYYRPYHNCLGSMQGAVMGDGTYLEIYEFEDTTRNNSGLARKETYCYPTWVSSYEVYAERGMNIDLAKAPELDIYPDRQNNMGSSWITVPDVLENSSSVQRYGITEEDLTAVFGEPDSADNPDMIEETTKSTRQEDNRYAFR